MEAKLFELRDAATFIPIMAVSMDAGTDADTYLLRRAGFGNNPGKYVTLVQINGGRGKASSDPYFWDCRTYSVAHDFIQKNFDTLESGAVVDVQYILGEHWLPKLSERETAGG